MFKFELLSENKVKIENLEFFIEQGKVTEFYIDGWDFDPKIAPLIFFEINDSLVNLGELILEVESAYQDLIDEDKKESEEWLDHVRAYSVPSV